MRGMAQAQYMDQVSQGNRMQVSSSTMSRMQGENFQTQSMLQMKQSEPGGDFIGQETMMMGPNGSTGNFMNQNMYRLSQLFQKQTNLISPMPQLGQNSQPRMFEGGNDMFQ